MRNSKRITAVIISLLLILSIYGCIPNADLSTFSPSPSPNVTNEPTNTPSPENGALIINHDFATLDILRSIPLEWINLARTDLHVYYNHTSHGSQITSGMEGLPDFIDGLDILPENTFAFNSSGNNGALQLWDQYSTDLGNSEWDEITNNFIESNPSVNVVMWSWCGQVSWASVEDIDDYLAKMSALETEYPNIKFVYMTGHTDGTGEEGNLNIRNNQIRQYCIDNDKILFDFADIESHDPDGNYYLDNNVTDNCDYELGGISHNWATEWQNAHTQSVDWYECSSAHSQSLNANMKAYAAWYLFARLAGYQGNS